MQLDFTRPSKPTDNGLCESFNGTLRDECLELEIEKFTAVAQLTTFGETMHSLTHDYPAVLLAAREAPCLSLYQPTHRQHPDNAQDPVRFRNPTERMPTETGAAAIYRF